MKPHDSRLCGILFGVPGAGAVPTGDSLACDSFLRWICAPKIYTILIFC